MGAGGRGNPMTGERRLITLAALILMLLAGRLLADAKSDYEMLFGEEAKKVLATKSTADDAAFAKRLLDAAKAMTDAPKTQVFIYEKVVQFGGKDATGATHALEAIDILIEAQPDQKAKWREVKLKVAEKQFQASRGLTRREAAKAYLDVLIEIAAAKTAAGDAKEAMELYRKGVPVAAYAEHKLSEIRERLRVLVGAVEGEAKREELIKKLADDPKDTKTREKLILFYVMEMDDPAKAASLLAEGVNEKMRKCVPLAAKKPGELGETACLALGDWYKQLAAKASPAGKAEALTRARMCYERFLSLHTKRDAAQYKGSAALAEVNKELEKLRGAAAKGKPVPPKSLTLDLGKGVTMKLVLIPAGSFMMGSPDSEKDRKAKEGPQHKVTISPGAPGFYMGITEVTVGQFGGFVGATGYKTQAEEHGGVWVFRKGKRKKVPGVSWRKCGFYQTPSHPVVCVSWNDAVAFCKWVGKKTARGVRLPTEAEWEYACRAGTKPRFCFGDDDKQLGDYAWYKANSRGKTHRVGQKKPNAWGLYDMHGNVWEPCADWYADSYANAKGVDPQGPATGENRVLRGGSWHDPPGTCRSANRLGIAPGFRTLNHGFRVVVEIK